jgi:AraC-like DNA-binding protein
VADILQDFPVRAPVTRVFDAVSRPDGLDRWWTKRSAGEPVEARVRAQALTVERLADHAAMSPRHFARAFTAETGMTPAKAVERSRLEMARAALERSHASLEQIAESTGFGDAGRMRRAFLRTFGLRRRRCAARHGARFSDRRRVLRA